MLLAPETESGSVSGAGAPLLRLESVGKSFGGLVVLSGIDLTIERGDLVGLIGPNGAGKSTLFNVITAIYAPDSGRVHLRGRDIAGTAPHRICRLGIARTFQLVRVFLTMTAFENVLVGAVYGGGGRVRDAAQAATRALELVGLAGRREARAAQLTLSDRRRLEIARAIASEPSLLLLDEPMAGLNAAETAGMVDLVRRILTEMDIATLWVEHKIDAITSACSRVVVLDHGEKIADGAPKDVVADRGVIEAYLGEPPAAA